MTKTIESMTPEDVGRSVVYIKREGGEEVGRVKRYDNEQKTAWVLYTSGDTAASTSYNRLVWSGRIPDLGVLDHDFDEVRELGADPLH